MYGKDRHNRCPFAKGHQNSAQKGTVLCLRAPFWYRLFLSVHPFIKGCQRFILSLVYKLFTNAGSLKCVPSFKLSGSVKCTEVTPKTKIENGEIGHEVTLDVANGIGQCKQLCEAAPQDHGFLCIILEWEDKPKTCKLFSQYTGLVEDKNFKVVICEEGT